MCCHLLSKPIHNFSSNVPFINQCNRGQDIVSLVAKAWNAHYVRIVVNGPEKYFLGTFVQSLHLESYGISNYFIQNLRLTKLPRNTSIYKKGKKNII
jgi:hypothetical protein